MNFESSALLIISAIAGILGVPIIDVIKKLFKVDGKIAFGIATVVSLVLAFISVFLEGQFTGAPLTLDQLVEASGYVFAVASAFYKLFLGDK